MGAFQSGFNIGQQSWDAAQRQLLAQREMEIREQEAAQRNERFGWERDANTRVNDAYANLDTVSAGVSPEQQGQITQTYGMTPRQVGKAAQGGPAALRERLASYDQPDSYDLQNVPAAGLPQRFTAGQVRTTPPSELDIERALEGVARATRNIGEIRNSRGEQKRIQGDDETRSFVTRTQELYKQRTASPEAMAAWTEHIKPYANMVSQFNGLDMDARVNPKTGEIEAIPYDGGKVERVTLEQALPYLLAGQKLTSQYGDPLKAVDALNKMSADERAKIMGDTNFRFGIGDKVSGSVHRRNQDQLAQQRNNIAAGARADANKARAQDGWTPIGASQDDKGLLFMNRAGQTEVRPLPTGFSAKDLFAKLTGNKAGDGSGMTKVPEDGSMVRDAKGNVYTYNEGEPIMRGGIAPKDRAATMKKLNLPAQAETMLKWEPGGRYVTIPGDNDTLYDLVNEPELVKQALDRVIVSGQAAGEMERRGGFTPRYPAGPEARMRANANEFARLRESRGLPH